jgi:hypothetical protein
LFAGCVVCVPLGAGADLAQHLPLHERVRGTKQQRVEERGGRAGCQSERSRTVIRVHPVSSGSSTNAQLAASPPRK